LLVWKVKDPQQPHCEMLVGRWNAFEQSTTNATSLEILK